LGLAGVPKTPWCPAVDYGNHASCLNHPDFQAYAVGLFSDLGANYDLDFIQTCMIPYVLPPQYLDRIPCAADPIEWALAAPGGGGCFCRHCLAAAAQDGFDLDTARPTLQHLAEQDWKRVLASGITAEQYLAGQPVLKRWLDFRRDSVNRLYARIAAAVKELQPRIELRWNHYTINHSYYSGIDLSTLTEHIDSIRLHAMVEQHGRLDLVEAKIDFLKAFGQAVPRGLPWLAAIDLRGSNPDVVAATARRAADTGCMGCVLSHYGASPLENFTAARRGLAASRWQHALGLDADGGDK